MSVVMPARNVERYVGAAIESILRQTFADFELIVVDDGSTDDTRAIAESFAAADARVRLVHVAADSASAARNAGLELARAELVALMDADDVALPTRLERQYAAARRQPEVVVWGAYLRRITEDGARMGTIQAGCRTTEEFARLDRTRSLIRCYGTVALFRRDVQRLAGPFDRRFDGLEDAELWDRMAEHGPVLVVPEVLQLYRQHDQSLSVRRVRATLTNHRYVTLRHAHRLRGCDLSFERFLEMERSRPLLRHLDDALRSFSLLQGRRYRVALARHHYPRAAWALTAMLLSHPGRFVRRFLDDLGSM